MTELNPTEQMTELFEAEAIHELNERKARRARDIEMSQPDANVLLSDPDTGFDDVRMTNRHWDDSKTEAFQKAFKVDALAGPSKVVFNNVDFGVISVDHAAPSAYSIIWQAKKEMVEREEAYDAPGGERSMAKTVAAFNAIHGLGMTEVQGWQFMELLKIVRSSQGKFKADNFVDGAAYAALAGEAAGAVGGLGTRA